jgi:tetratricopeptide (TPR) repeat protein
MSLFTPAVNIILMLSFAISAFAQWSDPGLPLTTGINMGNTGGIFSQPANDEDIDRPRTPFEILERKLAASRPHVDSDLGFAPGVVSVTELRHPISRAGVGLILQAEKYSSKGKHKEAIEVLKKALQDNSAVAYVRGLLGIEYLKIDNPQTAVTQLKEAITLQPARAANHSNFGYALCLIGDRAAGEREIREAIRIDRHFSKAHFILGVILLDKPTPEARDELLLVENDISLARLALAIYYTRREETASAQQELEAYLASSQSVEPARLGKWLGYIAALSRPTSVFGFPPPRD